MFSKLKKLTRRKSPKSPKSPKSSNSSKSKTLSTKKSKLSNMFATIKGSSLINKNLYPFWYNKIPFPKVSNTKDLSKEETWTAHLKLARKLYQNKSSLPKGSILFHGSSFIDPVKNINPTNKPFFFGLDAFISIWYISELASKNKSSLEDALQKLKNIENYVEHDKSMIKYADLNKKEAIEKQKLFIKSLEVLNNDFFNISNYDEFANYDKLLDDLKSHTRSHYYLNIYQTLQTIPYKYLSQSIETDNPIDDKECKNKACMHPQFGYHINVNELPVELSIEFTIPANQITNKLKLIGVYVIDVSILNANINKTFDEFKALEAIILKSYFTKNA
jgi:hypothetical protein